jgi:hypothetical protein
MRACFLGNFGVDYSSESHHAKSLESLGVEMIRLQEPKASYSAIIGEALRSDLFIWVHTHGWDTPGIKTALENIKLAGIPIITYHLDLYMPIPQRWRQYQDSPYLAQLDHFFTVDPKMADWLNENTGTQGHYLPAGVFGEECYISDQHSPHANDVIFVGSKGYHDCWPYRAKLIDWLRDTYGDRFTHVGGDGDTGTIRGAALNAVYANSKVAVGDTLCPDFDYPGYWSDRVYETLGRGGFLIHPYISGMEGHFKQGEHLQYYEYGDFELLKYQIDKYLDDPDWQPIGEKTRRAGHEHVKANHTYAHRWQTILDTVFP